MPTKKQEIHQNTHLNTHQHFVVTDEYFTTEENLDTVHYHNNAPCMCRCEGEEVYNVNHWYAISTLGIQRKTISDAYKFRWRPSYTSPVERAFEESIETYVLSALEHNYKYCCSNGKTYYLDYAHPPTKMAVEIDEEFHTRKINRMFDEIRQNALAKDGWVIYRVPQARLAEAVLEILPELKRFLPQ